MSFLLNHGYKFEVDTTPGSGTPTKERIAKGITSVDPDSNEESEETYYYDGGGAAERDITGFMLSYAFEGHRFYGDKAQDYIFSLMNKTGPARKTTFTVTEPNGDKWEGNATISGIKAPGGDANSKGEVEFTISFDGMPTFTKASVTP
ncbi:phage tail tube protein [Bacillus arachidis]|uniref:Capsid protein n=1 Tax=Bacillus arachidis TaxID=2819290 RepID=A0ABS3P4T2_9BACI|nr:capsid protein [Bacillus arachidis]MBO1628192.1 capsid protein [Bacillus arachidis]